VAAFFAGLVSVFALAQAPENRPKPAAVPAALEIAGRAVEVALTETGANTLRVSVSPVDGSGVPSVPPDSPALVKRDWPPPALRLRSITAEQTVKIGSFAVTVAPDRLRFTIRRQNGQLCQDLHVDKDNGNLFFSLGEGPVFGLGQGGAQFDRRGQKYSMRASHRGDRILNGGRVPIPWLMGSPGWGLFLNRPAGDIDLSGTEGSLSSWPGETSLPVDFFVAAADSPADLMTAYSRLTGFPHLPPLWALGYQQSHRTLVDKQAVFSIADRLRRDKLPCDVLIYLGTGFCPSGWNTQQPSFTFNPKVFSEPASDLRQLEAKNFKVVLHMVGPPARLYGAVNDAVSPVPDENEAHEYWAQHQPVSKLGVNGWWPDEGEQLSDASRMARIQMYWEGSQLDHAGLRPYALHRTGYAGMQRYGWLWSGDIASNWETLRTQLPVGLNTSLSGQPLWGTDIGGFYPTREFTGELFVRWFQFGAFSPLFRSHGIPSYLHFPWSWNSGDFGPPEIGNRPELALPDIAELHNPRVEPICRKYLELRYRLMPYLYSLVRESHETGLPVMRALWLHHSDDSQAAKIAGQYLWGRDLLVAPVLEKGASVRKLYLPRETWYDFWTETKTAGGREVSRDVDLGTLPLYVRAGAILPFGPVRQYTSEKVEAPLMLAVYPGADGAFVLYEDDGKTFAFAKGEFMKVRCDWKDSARQLTLTLVPGSRMLPPLRRSIEVRIVPAGPTRRVEFSGKTARLSF
jgi:alpha-glucosidase/alpha-D-xyloside xylohydrolase